MMNRIVYSALAIFCFAVVSCTTEIPMPEYGEDYIVLNVVNSPMTMAEDDATAYERQLNRLDCFFYVKDKTNEPCVYYHKAEVNELGGATIPFYVNDLRLKEIFPSGSLCDVYVIANIPGNPTFEAKGEGTTVEKLGELVLDMTEEEYDVKGKPFVMTGSARVQKGKNSSATADISLARVASKVTVTVKVPKSITVENSNGSSEKKWPVIADNEGNVPLKTSFNYGVNKGYLSGASLVDPENKNFITTDKISYKRLEDEGDHYVFTCEMPFYTYARSWDKGSSTAAYVTFEMPWGEDENGDGVMDNGYKTYYYQILVNGKERNFVPNTHYDMTVTVGVLGSTVESLPTQLDVWSYYILDWTKETENGEYGSGDRDENVEIQKFNYLEVPQTYIEMDNVNTVAIRYNASHKIGVKFDTTAGKSVEGLPGTTNLSAFYINNGSGTPAVAEISENILKDAFEDNNKGSLIFKCDLSELQKTLGLQYPIFSPVYVFITIWLDVDGDGVHDSDEILTENVKIVIYPAIFIVGDKSENFSVFVNGNYNKDRSTNISSNSDCPYYSINNQQVGKAVGYNKANQAEYMSIVSVSSFNDKINGFSMGGTQYSYIIGDPRSRESSKLGVSNGGNGWVQDGSGNYLTNYYPTSVEKSSDEKFGAFQMIAPKFRISSRLAGYSHCKTLEGAKYRCASYQEDGFPAGRWRLPTTAEVLFVINLQEEDQILELFVGTSNYLSATHTINNNGSITIREGVVLNNNQVSVRCVYDDWYWGSEPAAKKNSSYNNYGGYEFTWGDRFIY